eukprot:Skav203931  [mRNA]  locus=scaffold228:541336:543893:- [translate_table: standard]
MNKLENLISGEVESEDKDLELLVASLQHDKSKFGELVIDALQNLSPGEEGHSANLPENVTKLTDLLNANLSTQADSEGEEAWPLPPSESDSAPNAQNARWPILAALEQSCEDGLSDLGIAEAELHMTQGPLKRPKEMSFKELLKGTPQGEAVGEGDPAVTGVVDVMDRAMPGDLLLLETDSCRGFESISDFLQSALQEAESKGVVAVVLLLEELKDVPQKTLKKIWTQLIPEDLSERNLKTVVTLPKTETQSQEPMSLRISQAFFGVTKKMKKISKIAVVGEDDLQVRSASWLLFKILELHAGASKTGFINDRCSWIAQSQLGIFESLTTCAVQEILAGMSEAQVDFCIAQVLSSSESFDHVDFDIVLDLGGGRVPKRSAACMISPEGEVSQMKEEPESKLKARDEFEVCYSYEVPEVLPSLEAYLGRTKNELVEELEIRGADPSPSSSKKELLEQLQATLMDEAARNPRDSKVSKASKADHFHGKFTAVGFGGIQLQLGDSDLTLPNLKLCSANAITAAMCAAHHIIQAPAAPAKEGMLLGWEQCLASMPSIKAPPGTLELLSMPTTSDDESAVGTVGILHEASSSQEVQEGLKAMATFRSDPAAKFTVVFGCDGGVSRGDRAKCAWALAEHCDRIVLTSASPGVEPPMQIIEDMLEAIRAFRKWNKMKTPVEVFVISDRADAIKLGCMTPGPGDREVPDMTLVFGSCYQDSYEATDEYGQVRSWLFHDRRVLSEALRLAEDVRKDGTTLPWLQDKPRRRFLLPGRSLHWSYNIEITSDGELLELL